MNIFYFFKKIGSGGGFVFTPLPSLTDHLKKKNWPPQAKKICGPFFQKFVGFSKSFENLTVFIGFICF